MKRFSSIVFSFVSSVLFSQIPVIPDYSKGIDVFFVVDPLYPLQKSRLDLNASFFQSSNVTNFMVSPRMCTYVNGDFDINVGAGFRRLLDNGSEVGSHVFYDVSIQNPLLSHQVSFAGEYLTDGYDVRLNYYHPIKTFKPTSNIAEKGHKWCEVEVLKRLEKLSVGVSSIYNLTRQYFNIKPRVVVPFSKVNLEAGIMLSQNPQECGSYLSFSVPLFNKGQKTVCRSSTIRTGLKTLSFFDFFEKKSLVPASL